MATLTAPIRDSLYPLRAAAMDRFEALGYPTTRNEDWKYTNLAPWLRTPYERASQPVEVRSRPEQVRVSPIAELPGFAVFEHNALVALNTALFESGVHVEIPPGAVLEQPITIVHKAPGDARVALYPRVRITAGRDSQARVVEYYTGAGSHFTCAVTELSAAEGAIVEHYRVQTDSFDALQFHHLATWQQRSSNVASFNLALGGGLVRNEIVSVLDGEGAETSLNGLFVLTGKQHVDNHTTLDHAKPHATSHELYKGVLDGRSEGVFHGRIIVRPEAQKTDAIQRNRNLLLSKDAVINTKPQLEIYADDVRCTHGATVGQVDDDAVFYLRSRGIALAEARSLLTYAFASEIIDQIKVEEVRSQLGEELFRRLAGA